MKQRLQTQNKLALKPQGSFFLEKGWSLFAGGSSSEDGGDLGVVERHPPEPLSDIQRPLLPDDSVEAGQFILFTGEGSHKRGTRDPPGRTAVQGHLSPEVCIWG